MAAALLAMSKMSGCCLFVETASALQLLEEDALGFGRPKHDHAVKVIKVNALSQHVYHKKKPQAVGIIRRKA